jgi:serine/threonine protein phosphatase PrpC
VNEREQVELAESQQQSGAENDRSIPQPDRTDQEVIIRERGATDGALFAVLRDRLAGLSHPALVKLQAHFEQDGRVYVVQEEVPGISLANRKGHTSEREVVRWGIQLCQMLSFLHSHSLLCPDLCPEGLVIDRDGRLRLVGLDGVREKGVKQEETIVNDGYTAPEAYKNQEIDERADIFSLGATLYTLLTGKRLAVEGWVSAFEPPVFYPEKVVSPELERVLRKTLVPEPKDRYESAETLKADLLALGKVVRLRSAWYTDRGLRREHNEDSVLVVEGGQHTTAGTSAWGLYVVSDGMGGAESGEIASAIAVNTIAQRMGATWAEDFPSWTNERREECLRQAAEAANSEIVGYAREHPESAGMGATVVLGALCGSQLTLSWVGDSRAYLWEQGQLLRLSRDHSLVGRLVEIGQISEEEALTHEYRHVLIRSLGSKETVAVDGLSRTLQRGSRLVLCSDGLTTHVEEPVLADIVSRHRDPQEAALELVVAANARGGSDNTAVVVVFIE